MQIGQEYRRGLAGAALWFAAGLISIAAFVYIPALHYRLAPDINAAFHALIETVSIVVSGLVFAMGSLKVTRRQSGTVAVVSSAFLAVAILDFVHTVTFEGMPALVTPSGNGKAISFFLAARFIAAVALLMIAVMPWRRRYSGYQHVIAGIVLLFALGVSVAGFLPGVKELFFQPGLGLTPLKIGSEYLIIGLNVAAAVALAGRTRHRQPYPVIEFLVAAILMAVSETCFTLYSRPTDQYNNLGHLWKIVAYLFVFRGVLDYVIERPYKQLQRARADLFEAAERQRLIFSNSVDGVMVFDPDATISEANRAACELLRAPASRVVHSRARDWVEHCTPRLGRVLAQLRRTGRAEAHMRLRRLDGTSFEADVRAASYADRAGRQIASCVIRDVTERERARREILDLNATLEVRVLERTAELKAANEEMEAFSYSIAHDLRAPLSAIAGFCGALPRSEGDTLSARHVHFLERIRANTARMEEMISAILQLSRLSRVAVKPVQIDLSEFADAIVENLKRVEPHRHVDVRIDRPLPAYGDPALVAMVVQNLVGNAWKFTARRSPGRIWIGTQVDDDGSHFFFVRDNGEGFDAEAASHLFGLFCRLHDDPGFPGHGIGLANVHRIVNRHGGRIWAEAAPSLGATFYFTLPGAPAMPDATAAARRSRALVVV
jgi:hypothetical protein